MQKIISFGTFCSVIFSCHAMDFQTTSANHEHSANKQFSEEKNIVHTEDTDQSKFNTHLFEAVKCNDIEKIESLIKQGASVHAEEKYGNTPLFFVKSEKAATILLEHGATVNTRNYPVAGSSTPLHYAVRFQKDLALISCLLEHGAEVNAINKSGSSPLCYAASIEIADLLMMYNADNTICPHAQSPLRARISALRKFNQQ